MQNGPTFKRLEPGEPGPWFIQRSSGRERYVFDTTAGRYLVLCFVGSANDAAGKAAAEAAEAARSVFNDVHASFFAVSIDRTDEQNKRLKELVPGIRAIWDFDGSVSKSYGALDLDAMVAEGRLALRRQWVVLDPTMRVLKIFLFTEPGMSPATVIDYVRNLPPPERFAGREVYAPVLVLPQVFEPELCQRLMDEFAKSGGVESGFMREIEGRTVEVHDHSHKRRRDHNIDDQQLIGTLRDRVWRRIAPEIRKVHQFSPTRMERYIVSCYAAEETGHFRPHRDNTTKGTAHRRFAVSINLNAEFDGGEIGFPEYSNRTYKPPPGGAVVFSCSLLHWVSPVTRGRRFAFLPFLYDEEAARIRTENNKFLGQDVQTYDAELEKPADNSQQANGVDGRSRH